MTREAIESIALGPPPFWQELRVYKNYVYPSLNTLVNNTELFMPVSL